MKEAALKTDLIDKIEHADYNQLREIQGLLNNYFNGNADVEKWDSLPEWQKKQIEEGLKEADAGLGATFKEVTKSLREKYGLNG